MCFAPTATGRKLMEKRQKVYIPWGIGYRT
jgi:hypothetical protein